MCKKTILTVLLILCLGVSAFGADWTYVDCVDHALHPLAATSANMYFDANATEPVNASMAYKTNEIRFRDDRANGYYEGTLYEAHSAYEGGDPPVYVLIDTGAPGTYNIKLYGGFKVTDLRWNLQTSLDGGMTWSESITGADVNDVHGINGQGWVDPNTGLGTLIDYPETGDPRGNVIIGQATTDDGLIVVGIQKVGEDRGQFDGLAYQKTANIVWVTGTADSDEDGVQDDAGWVDWLAGQGYAVDFRPSNWSGSDLDPNKIAELEAADLIMISRRISSGDPKAATFNPLTTPIINLNAWTMRTSRMKWLNSGTALKYNGAPYLVLTEGMESHPIFDGVDLSEGFLEVLDPNIGAGEASEGNTSFVDIMDAGNGTVLAVAVGTTLDGQVFVAEWAPGVEYYEGAGQVAGGKRMAFMAGTQDLNTSDAPDQTIPPTSGVFNLTATGQQLMANAIEYMLIPPVTLPAEVAYYPMDEGTGVAVADASGNGHDGVILGDPNNCWVEGISETALQFGTLGCAGVDCNMWNPSADTNELTISCWVKFQTGGTKYQGIIANRTGYDHATNHWALECNGESGGVYFGSRNGSAYGLGLTMPEGEWAHIALTFDGTTAVAYLNGVETGTGGPKFGDDMNSTVRIGASEAGSNTFEGAIDEVRLYGVVLSAEEIAAVSAL